MPIFLSLNGRIRIELLSTVIKTKALFVRAIFVVQISIFHLLTTAVWKYRAIWVGEVSLLLNCLNSIEK